jgi:hypothetical protein
MNLANTVTVSMGKIHFNITLSSTSKCAIWVLCLFAGTGWRNVVQSRANTSLSACLRASSSRPISQDRGTFDAAETTHEMPQFQIPEYSNIQQYLIFTGLEFSLCLAG